MKLTKFLVKKRIELVLCCFSGGKDSLIATHLAYNEIKKHELKIPIEVIYVDTTLGLPEVIDYVKETCKFFKWKLRILRPKKSFWELASKWGMPTPKRKWCRRLLKLQPMLDYVSNLGIERVCFITGIRRNESKKRNKLPRVIKREFKNVISYNFAPILDWSDEEVNKYVKEHNLPINPIYNVFEFSGDCICVVYISINNLIKLAKYCPNVIEKFRILEEDWKNGKFKGKDYKPFYAQGKKLGVDDLLRMAFCNK